MITNFYIDAFNLYYGRLKGTAHKWLNLERFCQLHFPADQVQRIHYCTARVKSRLGDPQQANRQQMYLRALGTLPCVTIQEGYFLVKSLWMPYATPPVVGPATVEVIKSEEKGSDVNLATALLVDADEKKFEQAVVISNDSDLVSPHRNLAEEARTARRRPLSLWGWPITEFPSQQSGDFLPSRPVSASCRLAVRESFDGRDRCFTSRRRGESEVPPSRPGTQPGRTS